MARPKKTAEGTTATKKTTTRKKAEETKVEAPVEEQVNQVLDETTQEKVTETETPKPIGNLFGSINYNQTSDLDNFITNMTPDQGLYILVQGARAAHSRNAYTMEESETLSKAIRMIAKPADTPTDETPTEQPVEEVTE